MNKKTFKLEVYEEWGKKNGREWTAAWYWKKDRRYLDGRVKVYLYAYYLDEVDRYSLFN